MTDWRGAPLAVCLLGLALAGCAQDPETARWRLDGVPDPSSTEVAVLLTESSCASDEDATGRVEPAVVTEDAREVVITLRVRPRGGDQNCPSDPETPVVVQLDAPLGERVLLDGGAAPPTAAVTTSPGG